MNVPENTPTSHLPGSYPLSIFNPNLPKPAPRMVKHNRKTPHPLVVKAAEEALRKDDIGVIASVEPTELPAEVPAAELLLEENTAPVSVPVEQETTPEPVKFIRPNPVLTPWAPRLFIAPSHHPATIQLDSDVMVSAVMYLDVDKLEPEELERLISTVKFTSTRFGVEQEVPVVENTGTHSGRRALRLSVPGLSLSMGRLDLEYVAVDDTKKMIHLGGEVGFLTYENIHGRSVEVPLSRARSAGGVRLSLKEWVSAHAS